jgi:D-glycero-D-manno-heptose 1,7-bisphosphate phosphatase
MSGWGVFLDRDGTLVPDAVHPVRPEQLRFYASTGRGLRLLSEAGAVLAVVSNQSAVARGLLSESGLDRLDHRLQELFRGEGVRLAAAYYCPHHPDFTGPCSCRKPAPGMIERGLGELGIARQGSFLVGDTPGDLEAGRRVGLATVLVLTGQGRRARPEVLDRALADHVAGNLSSAARWIVECRRKWGREGS